MAYDVYARSSTSGASAEADSATATFAAAQTIDWGTARFQTVTMTANWTSLTFSGGAAGRIYCLKIAQDSTGSRTLSSPAASILWGGTTLYGSTHSAPTLTTTASKYDVFYFMCDGSNYIEIHRQMALG